MDSKIINYGKFVCGKMLGSTVVVSNITNQEQIIDMSVDQIAEQFQTSGLFSGCSQSDLPFQKHPLPSEMPNAELDLKCWYIENPINKDLVKHLTLRFNPHAQKEFIIVLKAPTNKISYDIASVINIRFANLRRQTSLGTGGKDSDTEVQKHIMSKAHSIHE